MKTDMKSIWPEYHQRAINQEIVWLSKNDIAYREHIS